MVYSKRIMFLSWFKGAFQSGYEIRFVQIPIFSRVYRLKCFKAPHVFVLTSSQRQSYFYFLFEVIQSSQLKNSKNFCFNQTFSYCLEKLARHLYVLVIQYGFHFRILSSVEEMLRDFYDDLSYDIFSFLLFSSLLINNI